MSIEATYNNELQIKFEIDGTETSTLDWEMCSWSVGGYMKGGQQNDSV